MNCTSENRSVISTWMCLHSKEIILEGKICLKLDYNQRTKIKAISGVLNNEKKTRSHKSSTLYCFELSVSSWFRVNTFNLISHSYLWNRMLRDHNPEKSWRNWQLCIKRRNFELSLRHKSKQYVENWRHNKRERQRIESSFEHSQQSLRKSYGLSKRNRFGVSFDNLAIGLYKCEEGKR